MAAMERTRHLKVKVSEEELVSIQAIAEKRGLTVSDVIRLFIRSEHRRCFPDLHTPVVQAK